MIKRIFTTTIIIMLSIFLTGCNTEKETNKKANCKIFDCINKIEPEDTVDEINEIFGFKGELIDKKYKIYEWQLNDDENIQVAYYSSDKSQIKLKYNRSDLKNKKVDFSNYENFKDDLKKGVKITYNDLVKSFKTKGTLVAKSSISKKYTWVSKNGSYLTATISNSNDRCTVLIGKVK